MMHDQATILDRENHQPTDSKSIANSFIRLIAKEMMSDEQRGELARQGEAELKASLKLTGKDENETSTRT